MEPALSPVPSDVLSQRLGPNPPWIVGIVNVTPDSFTDGGRFLAPEGAAAQARRLAAEGAALVELGAESTAPGSAALSYETELDRLLPVLDRLRGEMKLAIDTYHARTAERCLAEGAIAINDVSALRAEPDLAGVVAAAGGLLVLMHAKDAPLPHATDRPAHYDDVVGAVAGFLLSRAELAMRAGVPAEHIILDPGAGRFLSLDPADTWRLLAGFARFIELVRPFRAMVATSRKGFFGVPMAERDPLSQLTGLVAAMRGAGLIRTHDVRMASQFVEAGRRLELLPAVPA